MKEQREQKERKDQAEAENLAALFCGPRSVISVLSVLSILFVPAAALSSSPSYTEEVAPPAGQKSAQASTQPASSAQAPASAVSNTSTAQNGIPTEVVIKGQEGSQKISAQKPPLQIQTDPYDSIRDDLKPDKSLFLALPPLSTTWERTHPDSLNNDRVVEPWRLTFSQGSGLIFNVKDELFEALQKHLTDEEAKTYSWRLSIIDEGGRVFHRFSGSGDPPSHLVWEGQNSQGQWIKAGMAYSPVYVFTDPSGAPMTVTGRLILFHGTAHQEDKGLVITLDSMMLFGKDKQESEIKAPEAKDLLRASADLLKLRYAGFPLTVKGYASTRDIGEAQAAAVRKSLLEQLMAPLDQVKDAGATAPFADQRVEILILNR